jgi:succinylglutamate desuccinylase
VSKLYFNQLDHLPDGLLDARPETLLSILQKPTLINLPGKNAAPVFVSVLLHGNEPTGLIAVQSLLKKYEHQQLPRSLSLFFGNISAASRNLRRLDGQPDYNRIWPGTEEPDCAETEMAKEIFSLMKKSNVFASIDIHNNTGLNPHYACINRLDDQTLQLASLFGRLVVYFIRPKGVQSMAFAEICPAVTLECGRPWQQRGIDHAFGYLDSCLHLTELPQHRILPQDIDLFHTVAQVKINDEVNFSFNQVDTDLLLNADIELMNFTEISPGTVFGVSQNNAQMPLIARDEHGNIVTDEFFSVRNGELQINRATMPSMLTLDERIIKQDCLCYLMERIYL